MKAGKRSMTASMYSRHAKQARVGSSHRKEHHPALSKYVFSLVSSSKIFKKGRGQNDVDPKLQLSKFSQTLPQFCVSMHLRL
jgi:hypothetical protein